MAERPRRCSPTSPPCGSAVRPASWCAPRTEDELRRRRTPGRRGRHPVLLVAGGSNLVVADDGFDGTVVRGRDAAASRVEPATPAAARWSTVAAGEPLGRRSWRRAVDAAAGSASRRSPASPAASARPRSRTSAPTARRSPRPSPRCACWDRVERRAAHLRRRRLRLRLPHQPVQAGPRPATSSSAVTFQLRLGDLGAPVRYAELARTLGRRGRATARR